MTNEPTVERMPPDQRRSLIIEAANDVACETGSRGLLDVTHERVADQCAVPTSAATVRHYFHTLTDLRLAVVIRNSEFREQAIKLGISA